MNKVWMNECDLGHMPEDYQPLKKSAQMWAAHTHCFTYMFVIPFIEYQAAFLFVCSPRRHHIWVIAMKVGAVAKTLSATEVSQWS